MKAQQPYRAVFFDADDTIFDYQHAEQEAFRRLTEEFGLDDRIDEAHELYRKHNAEVWRALEEGTITQDELKIERFRRTLNDLGAGEADPAEMSVRYLDLLSQQTRLLPDAAGVVEDAAERYILVLVTNGLTTVQRRRFAASPVIRHFRKVLISEEVGTAKPDPAIFDSAFREFDLAPAEVLMVGDSTSSDMAAAENTGMDFCWVNRNGDQTPDGSSPRYVISRLDELRPVLGLES